MRVGVCGNRRTNVETRGMVLEVGVEEVGVDGVDDIAGDEEGVCVRAGDKGADRLFGEGVDDAFDDGGEEVAAGALAEERTDFFIVEKGDELDL